MIYLSVGIIYVGDSVVFVRIDINDDRVIFCHRSFHLLFTSNWLNASYATDWLSLFIWLLYKPNFRELGICPQNINEDICVAGFFK